jgi:hypothetical protein
MTTTCCQMGNGSVVPVPANTAHSTGGPLVPARRERLPSFAATKRPKRYSGFSTKSVSSSENSRTPHFRNSPKRLSTPNSGGENFWRVNRFILNDDLPSSRGRFRKRIAEYFWPLATDQEATNSVPDPCPVTFGLLETRLRRSDSRSRIRERVSRIKYPRNRGAACGNPQGSECQADSLFGTYATLLGGQARDGHANFRGRQHLEFAKDGKSIDLDPGRQVIGIAVVDVLGLTI